MQYRVTVMLPTEMYINAESMDEARNSIDWLLENYPQIDAPMSSATDTTMKVAPKIMTVEEQLDYDPAEGC